MTAEDDTGRSAFAWPDGRKAAVSLSFDDGRPSQLDAGLPILDGLGVKATFYVSIANVDRRLDAWRRAADNGHEIGNHTLSHPCSGNFPFSRDKALEEFTLGRMEADLLAANEAIRRRLGVVPTTFAYPCGQTYVGRGEQTRSYVPLVARHFTVGRSAFNETHNDAAFCDLAQAFSLDGDCQPLPRLREMVDAAVDAAGWLILMGHDVGTNGPRQVFRAAVLEALCRELLDPAREVWLDTVAAVGAYVRYRRGW